MYVFHQGTGAGCPACTSNPVPAPLTVHDKTTLSLLLVVADALEILQEQDPGVGVGALVGVGVGVGAAQALVFPLLVFDPPYLASAEVEQ